MTIEPSSVGVEVVVVEEEGIERVGTTEEGVIMSLVANEVISFFLLLLFDKSEVGRIELVPPTASTLG